MNDQEDVGVEQAVDPTELPEPTHTVWVCPECGNRTWVPIGAVGTQLEHRNRVFCGCDKQGIRMEQEGRVEL